MQVYDLNKRPYDEEVVNEAKDMPREVGEAKTIGVEPQFINGKVIGDKDGILIDRKMRQNSWTGEDVFRISDHKNNQTIIIDIPVTQEIIDFGLNRINEIKECTGRTPENLVRVVETMKSEFYKGDSII
jgi:hypothetical protein